MKSKEFMKGIEGATAEELVTKGRDLAEELLRLRFKKAAGQLEQSNRIVEVRRNLARVQTMLARRRKESSAQSVAA